MKALKKLSCVLLAVLLLMSLTVTAFAAEGDPVVSGPDATFTLTVKEASNGHVYNAYQIFSNTLTTEGTTETLTNITWGDGLTEAGQKALATGLGLAETASAKDVAEAMKDMDDSAVQALFKEFSADSKYVNVAHTLTQGADVYSATVPTGYYLIIDSANPASVENFSMTEVIVQVAGNVEVTPKAGNPEIEKKVQDDDGEGVDGTTPWQDYADYDIGDDVPFQFMITLPSNYNAYDTYELIIHDTMSAGLTLNAGSFEFTPALAEGSYSVSQVEGSSDFTLTISDLKTAATEKLGNNDTLTVTYTAKLNENAVIGGTGNPNEVYLEYSNNPNGDGIGHTPKDKVTVFTFQLVVNKVDKDHKPLSGAEFTIEKLTGPDPAAKESWTTLTVVASDKDGVTGVTFTASRLDEGIYRVSETKTPAGYNSIDPFFVKIDATDDGTTLSALDAVQVKYEGEKWVEVTEDAVAVLNGTVSTGVVSTDIVNQSGLQLPETGGIGTTIFYAVGGVLVAAALVLLITKKRMTKES